ncbi:hypothetical protein AN218_12695 [Streptomyces nanshensis]|uniref:Uncharacterized protein n=1 Tax=Streptomyces nanshensis TaxID=518642 RepID=A0A1E7L5K3_9ACTN|nr:hypothetical protein AN218_12695 [Streptomyces nanshensis]
MLGEVHVPAGPPVLAEVAVAADLRAGRELHEQRVEQVHGPGLLALGGGGEDGAQPGAHGAQPADVGLGGAAGGLPVGAAQFPYGLDRGELVLAAFGRLGVDQAHRQV